MIYGHRKYVILSTLKIEENEICVNETIINNWRSLYQSNEKETEIETFVNVL